MMKTSGRVPSQHLNAGLYRPNLANDSLGENLPGHLLAQQVFSEHLLCARHCLNCAGSIVIMNLLFLELSLISNVKNIKKPKDNDIDVREDKF